MSSSGVSYTDPTHLFSNQVRMEEIPLGIGDILQQCLHLLLYSLYCLYLSLFTNRAVSSVSIFDILDPNKTKEEVYSGLRALLYWEANLFDPEVGLDPKIHLGHFILPMAEQIIPPAPADVDITDLATLFTRLQAEHSDRAYYVQPNELEGNEDTPASLQQLSRGLQRLIGIFLKDGTYTIDSQTGKLSNPVALRNILKHTTHGLEDPQISPTIKQECLLGLARAGHRMCPTRITDEILAAYSRLNDAITVQDLEQQITKVLHEERNRILQVDMAEGDAHVYGELLQSIGSKIGIRHASLGFNDDPYYPIRYSPHRALPAFCKLYTSARLIQVVGHAFNGDPKRGGPPHERVGRQIPLALVSNWFQEHTPTGFVPENDDDLYCLRFIDKNTNTLSEDGVIVLLECLGIFKIPEVE